jgi:thioesterase domain-containing protein
MMGRNRPGEWLVAPQELQQYLYDKIPLSCAMQVLAVDVSEQVVRLSAPLTPNRNHRATVFGGSASTLAILSAWSLLHVRLQAPAPGVSIVIQRHSMEYERPMHGEFAACASLAAPEQWPRFLRALTRFGKARVVVDSILEYEGDRVGQFSGEFVAFAAS